MGETNAGVNVRVCVLNVCGINSKINNGFILDYVNNFDVLCLSECKTSQDDLLSNFITHNAKKVATKHRYPGVHGLQVYIRTELSPRCMLINDDELESKFIMWIKINNTFILGNAYLPHEASKHYHSDLFDELAIDICNLKSKFELPIMIVGDFNSRTGELDDFLLNDNFLDQFEDSDDVSIFKENNIPIQRSNCDRSINNNGRRLIELCKTHSLCIMNGRLGDDRGIGAFTCDDASVIDYVIASPELFKNVVDFKIDEFDSLLSDKHSPINFTIMAEVLTSEPEREKPDTNIKTKTSCKWDREKQEEFADIISRTDTDDIYELLNNEANDLGIICSSRINILASRIGEILTKSAKDLGMIKTIKLKPHPEHLKHPKWYNENCKMSKRRYKRIKYSNADKTLKREAAKIHKKMIKREKIQYEKQLQIKLKSLKSKNPRDYWSLLTGKKTSKTSNKLNTNDFATHFQSLLEVENQEVEDPVLNTSTDANQEINLPISIQEVKKHLAKLKNGKAHGIDNILNEYLKHMPDNLIDIITRFFNVVLDSGQVPESWTIGLIQGW